MPTFVTDLEATAQHHKGKFPIPPELEAAYMISRLHWTYETYLNTPHHIIEEILLLWRLENIGQEAANKG